MKRHKKGGKIAAAVFTVGCYRLRIAECLCEDDEAGMCYHEKIPAGQDDVTRRRNELDYICAVKKNDVAPDGRTEEYRMGGYGPDDTIAW
nr:hypothetical protein [uncultured Acetatifactor sp.]